MNSENSLRSNEEHFDSNQYLSTNPINSRATEHNNYKTYHSEQHRREDSQIYGVNLDEIKIEREDSKEEGEYGNITQEQSYQTQNNSKQYQTQNIHHQYLQKANLLQNSRDQGLNLFSNSFDESGSSFDLRPQRTCKSSTRMMSNSLNKSVVNPQVQTSFVQGSNNKNGALTGGSVNRMHSDFTGFMRQKQQLQQQIQNQHQQKILNQIQRTNSINPADPNTKQQVGQDLSNRSIILTPGGQAIINNSFMMNPYLQGNQKQPNTPLTANSASYGLQQMILSAGSAMNPRNGQAALNNTTGDPYAYLRYQQQKYKSCRSMIYNKNQQQAYNHLAKQQSQMQNNSTMIMDSRKGNQTTKNYIRSTSSTGSAQHSSSTAMTGAVVKSLSEVKNPQFFISFRFTDRKVTELKEISLFKNLTELDISGNLLHQEVPEIRQLSFLKKLNLSNNMIEDIYQLPSTLEILNLSYNKMKKLNPEVTSHLKNLTTLDVSNNGLETLDGLQSMKRLKRLLCKNNQIQELETLKEITTLVEIDLENNPVDNFAQILKVIVHKKDILVFNLKLSPLMLTIQSYEQFITELTNHTDPSLSNEIEILKNKLKFFSNGSLFRSKRVYSRVRTIQQHSKRSSSNFSNGSSSCGRGGHNLTANPALSPLLGNMATTPNQFTSQRNEDVELLYDEILDEEEELERKLNRIKRRKLKKELAEKGEHVDQSDDEEDDLEDDDESLDEDEYNQQVNSGDEDIDNLQSYRNHNLQDGKAPSDFLNESTADFNKEIKQIHQELKEELGNNFDNSEEPHSLMSTQSLKSNQTRKPISFKLDLSKCKQQQQDEDDDAEDEGQFEIPGLQFIKVTDDSFRQMQKQSIQHSKRSIAEQQVVKEQPKPIMKPIVIPKLQLGMLQKGPGQSLQQQSHKSLILSSKQNRIDTQKSKESERPLVKQEIVQPPKLEEPKCQNKECLKLQEQLLQLKKEQEQENKQYQEQISSLKSLLDDIRCSLNFKDDISTLPEYLKQQQTQFSQQKDDLQKLSKEIQDYTLKFKEIEQQNQESALIQYQQKLQQEQMRALHESQIQEKLDQIDNLKNQLNTLTNQNEDLRNELDQQQRTFSQKLKCFESVKDPEEDNYPQSLGTKAQHELIRKKSDNIQESGSQNQGTEPQYFYHQNSMGSFEEEPQSPLKNVENLNKRGKKQIICDIKKIKRPSSVATVGRKGSNLARLNGYITNSNQDNSATLNEYGSINNSKAEKMKLSLTMNKKVGVYIEKLKERNSSLQERLNLSLNQKGPLQTTGNLDLNTTQQDHFNTNQSMMMTSKHYQDFQNHALPIKSLVPASCSNKGSCSNILSFVQKPDKDLSVEENEYCTNNQGLGHQPQTQRFMSKKIKFNSLMQFNKNDLNKAKHEYSLNLGLINQSNDHLSSTQSDGNMMSSDRNKNHSFRGSGLNVKGLKGTATNNSFTLRNQRHI